MYLKKIVFLCSLGAVISAPVVLAGCGLSTSVSRPPADSMPMADHSMTMDLGPEDAEFNLRFIDGMILHHEGAIAMAIAALENSQRDEIKQLSQDIIAAQQDEIAQMKQWRQAWYPNASVEPVMYDAQMGHTMTMSSDMQAAMTMEGDLGNADDEFDLRFIDAMIPHHEGALAMADQVLQADSDSSQSVVRPELRQTSEDIVATQQVEIDQMEQWRRDWYGL